MAEPIGNDATGYDVLTAAMKSLLNQFPGLYPDEVIKFEELGSEDGIAFSNDTGIPDISARVYLLFLYTPAPRNHWKTQY